MAWREQRRPSIWAERREVRGKVDSQSWWRWWVKCHKDGEVRAEKERG